MASKQEYERAFQAWAQDKPEYRDVLKELKAEYARIFDAYFALELMSETIRTGELNRIYNRPSFGDEIYPQVKALNRDLFRVLYREYYDNCPQEYMVPLFAAEVERLGSPEAYAELMFEATHKEDESTEAPELEALRADIRTTVTRIFDELGKCSTRNPEQRAPERTLRPISRVCANGIRSVPSIPMPTSRCAWLTAR